jgi:triacylglycerol lipase
MSVLPHAAPAEAPAPRPLISTLHIDDVFAAGSRLWLRGRLALHHTPAAAGRRWWPRWRAKRTAPTVRRPALEVQVQTQVASATLNATVPLGPDGSFDACFETALPAARRGWRIARNQVTLGETTLRACSVVLEPPAEAQDGTIVVLPRAFTHDPGGVRQLPHWSLAGALADLFRRRQQGQAVPPPVYYLAAVPTDGTNLHPELALVVASLGWPAGSFVLVPATVGGAADALAGALDRLRWLLAGRLSLLVVNAEPSAEAALRIAARPLLDRAAVSCFVRSEEVEDAAAPPTCPARQPQICRPRPSRSRRVPRHPLVFCHGMLAMTMLRMQMPRDCNSFSNLRPFLHERGVESLFPNVEPTGGVTERAEQLRDQVRRWTDEPVNLIAHSMGGLDARFLISRLGFANRVRSLTTIATPHRGSALADWFCDNAHHGLPLLLTLKAFGVNVDGFSDCRPSRCRDFNARTPNAPGVRYFSYTAAVAPPRITPVLRRAWNILTPLEGPNDGIVSVGSARWGEDLGILGVDHFAQTPDGLFVRPDENFDVLGFYSRLVEDLARRGL